MERGGNVSGINQWNKIIFSKTILISPPHPFSMWWWWEVRKSVVNFQSKSK